MTGLILLIVLGSTIWVAVDAATRDFSNSGIARSAGAWAAGTLLLWIVFFPLYLAHRNRVPSKHHVGSGAPTPLLNHSPAPIAPSSTWSTAPEAVDLTGYKPCPDCAEPIRRAARKCRFCGWMRSA